MEAKINTKKVEAFGIKFFVEKEGKEVAHAFLYIMHNDLKKEPFGYMEDVFVDESLRGQGVGTTLVNSLIAEAKRIGCYKLVATSRYERSAVHKLYEKLGFERFGLEFKIYFNA